MKRIPHPGIPFLLLLLILFTLAAACMPARPAVTQTAPPTCTARPPAATPSPSPPPSPAPRCDETHGLVLGAAFYSAIQERDVTYYIYLPPCYAQTGRRYPYVILLHGITYSARHWLDLGIADALDYGIAHGDLPPMAAVMPDGGVIANLNDFTPGASFEDVIVDELIPALEDGGSGYCLWGARAGRAIGGISRGGFWAFGIALRRPELFAAAGGHSPVFTLEAPNLSNPVYLASTISRADLAGLRIAIDHGADENGQNNVPNFIEALERRHAAYEYTVDAGGHNDAYWAAHIAAYLDFYGRAWPRDPYALPGCDE